MPRHFLISQRWLKPCIGFVLPKNRIADSMPVEWDLPQEDEFALVALGVPSPYLSIAFPNEPPQFGQYYALDGLSPGELARWQQTLTRFLRQLIWNRPGRLVLKSPPHTFRLPVLEQLFPRPAICIVRDPYSVYASTVKLWKSLFAAQSYQRPTYEGLEERVLETFCRMYDSFEAARPQVDPQRICDVRYEDLVHDPRGQMRQIYERSGIGRFRTGSGSGGSLFRPAGGLSPQPLPADAPATRRCHPALAAVHAAVRVRSATDPMTGMRKRMTKRPQ